MKILVFSFFLFFLFVGESRATVAANDCKHNLSYDTNPDPEVDSRNVDVHATNASGEKQVCKFCHIPHGKDVPTLTSMTTTYQWYNDAYGVISYTDKEFRLPLFSHEITGYVNSARVSFSSGPPTYDTPYTQQIRISTWAYGPTSVIEDPSEDPGDETREIRWPSSGSSRMCFSCHDGTVKIGAVYSSTGGLTFIDMDNSAAASGKLSAEDKLVQRSLGGLAYLPPGLAEGSFWHDFASKHSAQHAFYSFRMPGDDVHQVGGANYDKRTSKPMRTLSYMRASGVLDRYDFVQCTACHDPHKGGDGTPAGNPGGIEGAYNSGTRQFWRKPGDSSSTVCNDCHG